MLHPPKKVWFTWAIAVLALGTLVFASRFFPLSKLAAAFTEYIQSKGVWGAVLFGLGYILATVLFFPGGLLTIAAGVAFGLVYGTVIASLSATIGAACAFLIARYFARRTIERLTQNNRKFQALDEAIGTHGWKIVILTRLSPAVPFNLSNYFYGLTKIGFWAYLLASFVGMLPGSVLYVYLGAIGQATLAGGNKRSKEEYIFWGVGLLATIVATIYLARLAKAVLKKRESV